MDVREAVQIAIDYAVEMESITSSKTEPLNTPEFLNARRFSIEATRFNPEKNIWSIEVGFTRPWDKAVRGALAGMAGGPASTGDTRTIKTVQISDEDGRVLNYGE